VELRVLTTRDWRHESKFSLAKMALIEGIPRLSRVSSVLSTNASAQLGRAPDQLRSVSCDERVPCGSMGAVAVRSPGYKSGLWIEWI
jgi:hypothetical protein